MKKTLNIMAEMLALPYSEGFIGEDPFIECAKNADICNEGTPEGIRTVDLDNKLQESDLWIADYINQFVEVPNLTILQDLIRYVFPGKRIVSNTIKNTFTNPKAAIQHYYFEQLLSLVEMYITSRDGYAVLRVWNGLSKEDLFQIQSESSGNATPESISFSPVKVELWNSLLRCFPEDLFLSSFAAYQAIRIGKKSSKDQTLKMLMSFGDHVLLEDILLDKVLKKGLAETHLHAGASRTFGLIWERLTEKALNDHELLEKDNYILPYKPTYKREAFKKEVLEAAFIRLLLSRYIMTDEMDLRDYLAGERFTDDYANNIRRGIEEIVEYGYAKHMITANYHSGEPIWKSGSPFTDTDIWSVLNLPEDFKKSFPDLAEKCLNCWSILHIMAYPKDKVFTSLFLYYLRIRSKAYRMRVQDGKNKGLAYFQKYYNLSTDRADTEPSENMLDLFYTALRDKRVIKTEFRVSPPKCTAGDMDTAVFKKENKIKEELLDFIKEHLYTLALMYSGKEFWAKRTDPGIRRLFCDKWKSAVDNIRAGNHDELRLVLQSFDIDINDIPLHRLGIIFHLIKQKEKNDSCFIRASTIERDNYKNFSFGMARFDYEASIKAICNLRNNSPEIARLIVGIDAASLEIGTDPWVFADAFRKARSLNSLWGEKESLLDRKPSLGITYHVGEDFRHPLSGLRHLDEALCELAMHPGDRIGHGFALGMDLARWFRKNEIAVLPRVEWMENNLWLWNLLSKGQQMTAISKYAKMLEYQILEDARAIYGSLSGITIENLYQAYMSRRMSVDSLQRIVQRVKLHCKPVRDCFQESQNNNSVLFPCWNEEKGTGVWNEDLLTLSYHCNYIKERMNENVLIMTTPAIEEMAEIVQKYMRDQIAMNGIIVETNPSSNTTIGEMEGILLHPINKLREDDDRKVMATVNTDDPSVFNATVANEHAQIYYALRYNGMSVEKALDEIDQMRETALRTSFIGELIPMKELMNEYETIIRQVT